jgi:hypothetical protein
VEALAAAGHDHAARPRDRALLEVLYSAGTRARKPSASIAPTSTSGVGVARVQGKGRKERLVARSEPRCLRGAATIPGRIRARGRAAHVRAAASALFPSMRAGGRLTTRSLGRIVESVLLHSGSCGAASHGRTTIGATALPRHLLDCRRDLRSVHRSCSGQFGHLATNPRSNTHVSIGALAGDLRESSHTDRVAGARDLQPCQAPQKSARRRHFPPTTETVTYPTKKCGPQEFGLIDEDRSTARQYGIASVDKVGLETEIGGKRAATSGCPNNRRTTTLLRAAAMRSHP